MDLTGQVRRQHSRRQRQEILREQTGRDAR
jgi:hypothetical protein